jgi:DNA polymerase III delta subunit
MPILSGFAGDKMTPDELGLFIAASPFLAPRRLVIASGVLERFETIAARRSGGNNKHKSNQQDLAQAFSQAIMSAPESTLLVMVCRTLSRNNMLLELIGSHVKRQDFPVIKGVDLQRWISERISIAGGTIKQDALQLLVNRLDTDLWRLSNEIKKLLLYCVDGTITVKEVEQLVALSDEASIFKLVDLVMNSNTSLAQAELSKLLQEGTSPFQVISMLARQVRLIILAKEMLRENLKRPDIQAKLNIKHEFILRKTIEQAGYTRTKILRLPTTGYWVRI